MDLSDDTPLVVIPPEAYIKADEMRAILAADLEESSIAQLVVDFVIADIELEIAAWSLLTWKEQEGWRQYRQQWRQLRKHNAYMDGNNTVRPFKASR